MFSAEEEVVLYGIVERRILEIGLQAGIPYEKLRDWYCELIMGEIDISQLVQRVDQRARDCASRELLAEIKSLSPRIAANG
jgi:hypothetical protein